MILGLTGGIAPLLGGALMHGLEKWHVHLVGFSMTNFHVTFPLFAKIDVNGSAAHPLYAWLKQEKGGLIGSGIKWNFTKFLLDWNGSVSARFAPTKTPEGLARDVAALL